MDQKPNILIFDSGAGGLSIAREVLQRIQHCHLTYVADNAEFPYGNMEDQRLSERVLTLQRQFIKKCEPNIVIIACNTVSTLVLSLLREEHPKIDFVGVVPAIKPAAKLSQSGHIGVLATPATISRSYTQDLIRDFATNTEVFLYGSEILVHEAEQKVQNEDQNMHLIFKEIDSLLSLDSLQLIDTIVLACTHFPLLKKSFLSHPKIKEKNIAIVDSGEAVANRTVDRLEMVFDSDKFGIKKPTVRVIFTIENQKKRKAFEAFLLNSFQQN